MSLISEIVAFAKSDAAAKGVPVLITFLQNLGSAQNGLQRAAALAQFEGNALLVGAQIGQDILQDANTQLQAELTSLVGPAPSTPAKTA